MQTMMIDSKNKRFFEFKKMLDDKVEKFRSERRMHSVTRNTYYNEGKIDYYEFVYGFSDEDAIPAAIKNADKEGDPEFGTFESPVVEDIKGYITELGGLSIDEKTLYEGLSNKAAVEGWTIDDIAGALSKPKSAVQATFDKYGITFGKVAPAPTPSPTPGPSPAPTPGPSPAPGPTPTAAPGGGTGTDPDDPTVVPTVYGLQDIVVSGSGVGYIEQNEGMRFEISHGPAGGRFDWQVTENASNVTRGASGSGNMNSNGLSGIEVYGTAVGSYSVRITFYSTSGPNQTSVYDVVGTMFQSKYNYTVSLSPTPSLNQYFTVNISSTKPNTTYTVQVTKYITSPFSTSVYLYTVVTSDNYGDARTSFKISEAGSYSVDLMSGTNTLGTAGFSV